MDRRSIAAQSVSIEESPVVGVESIDGFTAGVVTASSTFNTAELSPSLKVILIVCSPVERVSKNSGANVIIVLPFVAL